MQALEHITILDLTHMLSGPFATMLLTDLGANTIKVEPPLVGEATRSLLRGSPLYSRHDQGAYFITLNRNKKSVGIDLKNPEGRELFLKLCQHADVVAYNFGVGVMDRLGLGTDVLSATNPRLITCSITGFGETGPNAHDVAFDQVVQAMGGGMSITGLPESIPTRAGIPIGDLGGGLYAALGILAALEKRRKTGCGSHLDIAMLDCQISMLNYMATMYLMSGVKPDRLGNGHFVHVPYNTYTTRDGYIVVACIGDTFFERFKAICQIELLQDPRYTKQAARLQDKRRIDEAINRYFAKETTEHWIKVLKGARIPCGPVYEFDEALSNEQIDARKMLITVPLEGGGVVRAPGNPIKFDKETDKVIKAPPTLGRDTREVLSSLGRISADEIMRLYAAGVVA